MRNPRKAQGAAADAPAAIVRHRMSGRLRLHVPAQRGNPSFFSAVVQELSRCEAVRGVTANEITGGLLIIHDGAAETVQQFAERNGLFRLSSLEESTTPMMERISEGLWSADRRVVRLSNGEIDLKGAAFLMLILVSAVQMLRGNFAVPALTALWYAAETVTIRLPEQEIYGRNPTDKRK